MNEDSLKGHFLAANSGLKESYFSETVILMIEHDYLGSFGLILNKLDNRKKDLSDLLGIINNKTRTIPLYEGGPVGEETLFIVHSDATIREPGEEIMPGVFWGSSIELFEDLIEGPFPFNIYRGYAGWGPGQLEDELQSKSWIVLPPSDEIIFNDSPETIWRQTLSNSGGLYSYFAEKVRDPLLN